MEKNSQYWITKLGLVKHIEGGYYNQIYVSNKKCQEHENRNLATCIFYLLDGIMIFLHSIKLMDVMKYGTFLLEAV